MTIAVFTSGSANVASRPTSDGECVSGNGECSTNLGNQCAFTNLDSVSNSCQSMLRDSGSTSINTEQTV